MELLFWLSILTLVYTYIGYPVLLFFLAKLKSQQPGFTEGPLPDVSLIIAAHNEETVIKRKLENSLTLDYPRKKMEIIVVSDHSTDRTEEIVSDYAPFGVTLLRTEVRVGKTGAQNEAAHRARGAILVFSDANSIWEKGALKKLVQPFSDDSVGYVCGQLKYTNTGEGKSSYAEGLYWRYEIFLRRLESAVGSITAGNGAIYAVRASDYYHFRNEQSHDFEYPRHVTSKGKRAVYIHEAIACEKAGKTTGDEFKRKVRMLARVWGSILKSPGMFSPIRSNLIYAWELTSHRLLRYLAPLPQALAFASNIALYPKGFFYQALLAIQITFYSLALLSAVYQFRPKLFYIPYYLCMFNCASILGLVKSICGPAPAYWEKAQSTRA